MSNSPAWYALGLAALSFAWTELRVRRAVTARRRLGPASETRQALEQLRVAAGDVIAAGGMPTSWFIAEERRGLEQQLTDLAHRTTDDVLRDQLTSAAVEWRGAFAAAPGSLGAIFLGVEPTDVELKYARDRQASFQRQDKHVRAALVMAERGLLRLGDLEKGV